MLEQMRGATRSWLGYIVGGVLIVSFALWGVQDIFTTDLNDPIAKVGDIDVSAQDFIVAFSQEFRTTQNQLGGQFTQTDALAIEMDRDVIRGIAQRLLVDRVADDFDLRVSDARISTEIRANSNFFGVTGSFDQQTFNEMLRSVGTNGELFAEDMRENLERSQLLSSLTSGVFMPQEMVSTLFEYSFEERIMEYFLLPADAAGEIDDAGQAELEAFYLDNLSNYRLPEYRGLTVLLINAGNMVDSIEITDEQIERTYNIRQRTYHIPERRSIDQLAFGSEAEALAGRAALEAGTPFTDVDAAYIDLGSVSSLQMGDPVVSEAAFALTEPGRTGVVAGALAFTILRVTNITPEQNTPLEEVSEAIRLSLATQLAEEELYAINDQAADMRAGGETLEAIAQRLGQQVFTIEAVDASGLDRDGEVVTELAGLRAVLIDGFTTQLGDDSNFEPIEGNGFYDVRVDSVTPASVHPYADVPDRVLLDWRNEQVRARLEVLSTELSNRINAGEDFTNVAAESGRIVRVTPSALRRGGTTEIFTADVLNQLFSVPVGTTVPGAIQLGNTHLVAQVTVVEAADMSASQAAMVTLQAQLNRTMTNEIVTSFVEDAESRNPLRINNDVLIQALNNLNQ